MKIRLLCLLLLAASAAGCSKDDQESSGRLKNCKVQYLFFRDNICFGSGEAYGFPASGSPIVCSYSYHSGTLARVSGIFVRVPAGTNLNNFVFYDTAYDSLAVSGNDYRVYSKIPIDNDTIFEFTPNASLFTLTEDKKLILIHMNNGLTSAGYDLLYTYLGNEITETNSTSSTTRKFIFENGNLVTVLTERSIGHPFVTYRKEILFTGYDNHPNPFRYMYYVPGAFFRAFSVNNYTGYTVNEYSLASDSTLQLTNTATVTLPVTYNDAGYPLFGEYE